MNLYEFIGCDRDGDGIDAFISAPSADAAQRIFDDWLGGELKPDVLQGARVRLFQIMPQQRAKVLAWNEEVIELRNPPPLPHSLAEQNLGPRFVITSWRAQVATAATCTNDALALTDDGPSPGVTALRQCNDTAYIFDRASCIAVATLINQGFDAVYAAGLVYHDIVFAIRCDRHDCASEWDEGARLRIDLVQLRDGSWWEVFADQDILQINPDKLDLVGYHVVASSKFDPNIGLVDAVHQAIGINSVSTKLRQRAKLLDLPAVDAEGRSKPL